MPKEGEPRPDIRLSSLHIDFVEQIVTLQAVDGRTARYSFAPAASLFDAKPEALPSIPAEGHEQSLPPSDPPTNPVPEPAVSERASANQEQREKQTTVTLSGRLKTQPKPGRPDAKGKPTAWARLAVHEENSPDAKMYATTFHRHTAAIALGLPKDAPVTVEGYPHERTDSSGKRMATFSVINLLYPGKPEKPRRERRRERRS